MKNAFKVGMVGVGMFISAVGLASAQSTVASSSTPTAAPDDWVTWGYDQERTGWNKGESTLNKDNVSQMKLLWGTKVNQPVTNAVLSTLTAPLVVAGVPTSSGRKDLVIVLGANNNLFALDANNGKVVWQKSFPNELKPLKADSWLCPNTANATPTVDKQRGLVFFLTTDGKLHAVSVANGSERMEPIETVAPFSRSWSLNLIDNVVYTTSSRGCASLLDKNSPISMASTVTSPGRGGAPTTQAEPGSISAVDVGDLKHPSVTHFFTSGGRTNGPWGRGGVAKTPKGIVTQTADGPNDPAMGDFGETVLELTPKATRLLDSFTPDSWADMNAHDLDFGSAGPIVFPFKGHTLVATSSKQAIVYLLDADSLGGKSPDHSTPLYASPQIGNDDKQSIEPGQGVWGSMATYETPDGHRYIYAPMWGPPSKFAPEFAHSYGAAPNGSIMAFEVVENRNNIGLVPQWISTNMTVPDPPVAANGVVYAIQTGEQTLQIRPRPPGSAPAGGRGAFNIDDANAFRATPVSNLVLYAFDAQTGKQLYSSGSTISDWTHFSEPVVALGKVFVVTHDAHVYAFGLGR